MMLMSRRTLAWIVLTVVVSMVLTALASVLYTNHVANQAARDERDNDRRWCIFLATLDNAYKMTPPTTDTGRNVARAVADLRRDLGCGP